MMPIFDYPATLLIVAPLVIVFAYFVFGIGGFGSAIVAIPLLAHWLPLTFLVPLFVVLDFTASLTVGRRAAAHVARDEIKWLAPCMLIGIVLGVTLLVSLPQAPLLITLGIFACLVGIQNLASPHFKGRISKFWSIPAGVAGGALGALFGTGGPVYVIYLSKRLADKSQVRATVSVMITLSTILRIASYLIGGLLLSAKLLFTALLLLPLAFLGIALGTRLHLGLSDVQTRRMIGILLLLSGTSLLYRHL